MSFMTEYGASHLFVRAFHLVPVIVLRLFTVSVSYGSVIMSLPFLSLMEVSPIGWSGSCSRMSSWLISIFHDFAKSMAVLRWGSGIQFVFSGGCRSWCRFGGVWLIAGSVFSAFLVIVL